jgi:hypothetical protein
MQGPNEAFREYIAERIDGLETADDAEEALDNILGEIRGQAAEDQLEALGDENDAYRELAAIEAWASLASNAVQALYEERSASRFKLNLRRRGKKDEAGWSRRAAERLREIARALEPKLRAVCDALEGVGFGVGVAFPGGVSIFIQYTI